MDAGGQLHGVAVYDAWWRYLYAMVHRHRVVYVFSNGQPVAICTFFLASDLHYVSRFHQRPLWSIAEDDPTGIFCYVDKLIAKQWNGTIRRRIQQEILRAYPHVTSAAWFRPAIRGADRLVLKEITHVAAV